MKPINEAIKSLGLIKDLLEQGKYDAKSIKVIKTILERYKERHVAQNLAFEYQTAVKALQDIREVLDE